MKLSVVVHANFSYFFRSRIAFEAYITQWEGVFVPFLYIFLTI